MTNNGQSVRQTNNGQVGPEKHPLPRLSLILQSFRNKVKCHGPEEAYALQLVEL